MSQGRTLGLGPPFVNKRDRRGTPPSTGARPHAGAVRLNQVFKGELRSAERGAAPIVTYWLEPLNSSAAAPTAPVSRCLGRS